MWEIQATSPRESHEELRSSKTPQTKTQELINASFPNNGDISAIGSFFLAPNIGLEALHMLREGNLGLMP